MIVNEKREVIPPTSLRLSSENKNKKVGGQKVGMMHHRTDLFPETKRFSCKT